MWCREANDYQKAQKDKYHSALANGPARRPAYFPDPSPMAKPKEARFQVVTSMPCISSRSPKAIPQWGLSCTGCRNHKPTDAQKKSGAARKILAKQVKLYSKEGFVEHVMVCTHAQRLFADEFDHILERKTKIPTTNACALASNGDGNVKDYWGTWPWTPCANFYFVHASPYW